MSAPRATTFPVGRTPLADWIASIFIPFDLEYAWAHFPIREDSIMASNISVRAFKCPSCGGPLEPESGTLTMKCPYCGSTVIIPESLRTAPPSAGPTMGQVFDFGLKGIDLNKVVGNAMQLPQAISLAQQGRIDEAANIYSQITGMEHADAVKAVESMAAGHAVSLTPGRPGVTWQSFETTCRQPDDQPSGSGTSSEKLSTGTGSRGRSCSVLVGVIAAVAVLIGVFAAGGLVILAPSKSTGGLLPVGFASRTLSFGTEGIGPGMFQDPRSIGVDANGNITVADYQDGRIQTFDPTGKYASGFSLSPDGKKVYISGMAVGRDGKIYLAHNQKIYVYDARGKEIGEIGDDQHDYEGVTMGGDGRLYAISNQESIVRFQPDGTVDLEIRETFAKVTGDMDIDTHLAADGLGNMYLVGSFHYLVLKYSPQGTYVDQFGGEAKGSALTEPGKFTSPTAIAVDGYGRIYVADFFAIQVFDADGTYLNQIAVNKGAVFGMAFDDQNHLYLVTNQNQVMKYDIRPPVSD